MRRDERSRTLADVPRKVSEVERARSFRHPEPFQFRTEDFEWSADLRETGLTLRFTGTLDERAVRIAWPGIERTTSIVRTLVVLDLAEVNFIDRMGLRLLLKLQLLTDGAGSRLVLSSPSRVVRRVIDAVGLTHQFEFLDGQSSAMLWCPSCGRRLVPSLQTCPSCGNAL